MVGLVGTGAFFPISHPTPKERVIEDIISFELIAIEKGHNEETQRKRKTVPEKATEEGGHAPGFKLGKG